MEIRVKTKALSCSVQDYARLHGYDFVLGIKQVDPQLENMWNKPGKAVRLNSVMSSEILLSLTRVSGMSLCSVDCLDTITSSSASRQQRIGRLLNWLQGCQD